MTLRPNVPRWSRAIPTSIAVCHHLLPSARLLIGDVIDEITLDIAPVLLGWGERIFDGVESFGFEPAEVLHSPLTTHISYRRVS
jgi:hypothetical protein